MDEQLEFLLQTTRRLDEAGVAYMITGSVALSLYATPRMTRDIDFVIELRPEEAGSLVAQFEADCYVDADAVRRAVAARGMFNIIHNEWITKADFVVRKDTSYRKVEFDRRRTLEIGGRSIQVVAPEDLILSKLCWSKQSPSEQQERDVRTLLGCGTPLDIAYLSDWARKLGVQDALERLSS